MYELIEEGEVLGYEYRITSHPKRTAAQKYRWHLYLAGERLCFGHAAFEEQAYNDLVIAAIHELEG